MEMRKKFVIHNRTRGNSQVQEEDKQAATFVAVTYSTDYDIIALDETIRNLIYLHNENQSTELKRQLADIQEKINYCDIVIEMREYEVKRANLLSRLTEIDKQIMLKNYISLSAPLLDKYRDTPIGDRIIDAMSISHQSTAGEMIRERAVDAYMSIVLNLRLPQVTIVKEKNESVDKTQLCVTCNAYLGGCDVLLSGFIICSSCRSTNKPRASGSTSKEYDVLTNFMKAHKRYIGATLPKCDMDLALLDLDKYFTKRGEPDGEHYRSLPLNEWGGKDGTSTDMLCIALKALGYDELYKNYRYIGHHYYGWELFDLRHIEDTIIHNFRVKQEAWDDVMTNADKGDRSSLSTEYRLCREYQHAGHNCRLIDFKVPRKKSTIERYDKSYSIMCQLSGFGDIFSIE